MPLILTIAVIFLVVLYLRSNQRARQRWLKTLDLPGRWLLQPHEDVSEPAKSEGTVTSAERSQDQEQGDDEGADKQDPSNQDAPYHDAPYQDAPYQDAWPSTLVLFGELGGGRFEWVTPAATLRGDWSYRAGALRLQAEGQIYELQVRFLRPGVISLLKADGTAELFHKQSTNVVTLGTK